MLSGLYCTLVAEYSGSRGAIRLEGLQDEVEKAFQAGARRNHYRSDAAFATNMNHFEYREQFEELSAEAPHVPIDVLEDIFLHGMKRSLREQVVRYKTTGDISWNLPTFNYGI